MAPGTVKLRESLQQSWRIYLVLSNAAEQLSCQQCWERIWERILTPFRKREAACRAWFGQKAWVPG